LGRCKTGPLGAAILILAAKIREKREAGKLKRGKMGGWEDKKL